MSNVSKAMEYATAFEREAMHEKLDAALGDLDHMNLIQLEEMVLHHRQQIKDIAAHLLELRKWGTPMMEFKQEKPTTMGMEYAANFESAEKLLEKKEWVGLTDEEVKQCSYDAAGFMIDREVAMRAVEAKLKEKNGG